VNNKKKLLFCGSLEGISGYAEYARSSLKVLLNSKKITEEYDIRILNYGGNSGITKINE